jgi:hypothetical protein
LTTEARYALTLLQLDSATRAAKFEPTAAKRAQDLNAAAVKLEQRLRITTR